MPFWEISGYPTSLVGNRERCEVISSPSHLETPAANPPLHLTLLHSTCCPPGLHPHAPHPPVGSVTSYSLGLAGDWGRAGQNTEHLLSSIFCVSTQIIFLLLWDRQTASYITLQPPKSNVYSWTSCPGPRFTNQNWLESPKAFFSFSPVSPLPGSVGASNWMGARQGFS